MKSPKNTAPPHEEVARLAYAIWEREGRPHGRAVEHWLQAMAQLAGVDGEDTAPSKPRVGPKRKLGLIEIALMPVATTDN